MMRKGLLLLLGMALVLTACAGDHRLPYRAWHLSFSAVANMDVFVEDARVVDVTGRIFHGYGVGGVDNPSAKPAIGWNSDTRHGPGFYIMGAALPKQIYVRWQSLAEPQTYQATLNIPDAVRKLMLTKGLPDPRFKHASPEEYYYNRINLGLAPGGWIKVWLSGALEDSIPVMCVKATIVPQGPSMGKTHGAYAYRFDQFDPRTQKYLKTHAIPYSSWDCKKH